MANRRISIKDKDVKGKKGKKERDKIYHKMKASKLYGIALMSFISLFIITIFSPMVTGKSYDYTTVDINEPQMISNSLVLLVTDIEINREDGLLKLVINYEDESNSKSLSNMKYNYKLNFIENKNDSNAKGKIIEVTEKHTVIYYENLPKDFGVVSVTIEPRYVYPDLETSDDLAEKEIKFYIVDEDVKENDKLVVKNDMELKIESFEYQVQKINDSIKNEEDSIDKNNVAIELANNDIMTMKEEMDFQTSDEKTETQNNISSKENSISVIKEEIEVSKSKISELNKKIEELNKNKMKIK